MAGRGDRGNGGHARRWRGSPRYSRTVTAVLAAAPAATVAERLARAPARVAIGGPAAGAAHGTHPRSGPIVVLTGAGISAESGLPTFRGAGGLWEGHRVEEVATPERVRPRSRCWCIASTTSAAPGCGTRRRAQPRPSGPGRARAPLAGGFPAGHPECRRSARARGQPAAGPSPRRADARAVPRLRRLGGLGCRPGRRIRSARAAP